MMETEKDEDDEDLSISPSLNFIKLKTINSKLLSSIFKEQEHSKFKFQTTLKRINQYSNINNIKSYQGLYAAMRRY